MSRTALRIIRGLIWLALGYIVGQVIGAWLLVLDAAWRQS